MKKGYFILIVFFLVLLTPFAIAWFMVERGPSKLKLNHHGDLISPVQNVNKLVEFPQKLEGKWWLVYVAPPKCQESCQNTLYNMRQIRTALGKNALRLERLMITDPTCPGSVCEDFLNQHYPDMKKVNFTPEHFEKLIATLSNKTEREMVGELYLVDPQGNAMMRYSVETPARDLLQDIKRLLKVSKTG